MAMLDRKLALVTGASSGIGFELARQFARNDHDLIIVADDEMQLSDARRRLESEFPGAAITDIVADLSRREATEDFWQTAVSTGRPIDVLAANAGKGVAGPFAETDLEEEVETIQLNVTSQVVIVKRALAAMLAQGHGKILITSSLIALSPGPRMAIYAATKAFLHSFALAIRDELKDAPITVTALMPGATETDFWERAEMEDTNIGKSRKASAESVAKEGYDALESGSAYVVPGMSNKVRAGLTALTPDTILAWANRDQAKEPN